MFFKTDSNYNWDLAILTAVILVLLFFWFYKFLFITDPSNLLIPITQGITSDSLSL